MWGFEGLSGCRGGSRYEVIDAQSLVCEVRKVLVREEGLEIRGLLVGGKDVSHAG